MNLTFKQCSPTGARLLDSDDLLQRGSRCSTDSPVPAVDDLLWPEQVAESSDPDATVAASAVVAGRIGYRDDQDMYAAALLWQMFLKGDVFKHQDFWAAWLEMITHASKRRIEPVCSTQYVLETGL